ncbi:MAG: hypothetical protein K0V04_42665 [Deltaproteobacteria bacterium]|nr:hypothetical protein [Deltaproteobacteria bacterium]
MLSLALSSVVLAAAVAPFGGAAPPPEIPEPTPPVLPQTPGGAVPEANVTATEAPSDGPAADERTAVPAAPVVEPPEVATVESASAPSPIGPSRASADPFESLPTADAERPPGLQAGLDLGNDYVTVRQPRWRGTGLFITAGIGYAMGVAYQAGDAAICGDCAIGVVERVFLASSIGAAAGAGVLRAHADAYDDVALGRKKRNSRRALIAGAALTGIGAVVGLANEGMWWRCVLDGSGPYSVPDTNFDFDIGPSCRTSLSRAMLDISTGASATGIGLLTWAIVYRRDARAYQRARVISLRPRATRDQWGLTLEGRF